MKHFFYTPFFGLLLCITSALLVLFSVYEFLKWAATW